jgi:hypothetical protein
LLDQQQDWVILRKTVTGGAIIHVERPFGQEEER